MVGPYPEVEINEREIGFRNGGRMRFSFLIIYKIEIPFDILVEMKKTVIYMI